MDCYTSRPMTVEAAKRINKWRYEPPYDFYNEAPNAKINDASVVDYFLIECEKRLFGFYCLSEEAQVKAGHDACVYR